MKLKWTTNGQFTRSGEGRFVIVHYSYEHLSQPQPDNFSTTDYVRQNRYDFASLRKAKAFCQEKLNQEIENLSKPLRAL